MYSKEDKGLQAITGSASLIPTSFQAFFQQLRTLPTVTLIQQNIMLKTFLVVKPSIPPIKVLYPEGGCSLSVYGGLAIPEQNTTEGSERVRNFKSFPRLKQ